MESLKQRKLKFCLLVKVIQKLYSKVNFNALIDKYSHFYRRTIWKETTLPRNLFRNLDSNFSKTIDNKRFLKDCLSYRNPTTNSPSFKKTPGFTDGNRKTVAAIFLLYRRSHCSFIVDEDKTVLKTYQPPHRIIFNIKCNII